MDPRSAINSKQNKHKENNPTAHQKNRKAGLKKKTLKSSQIKKTHYIPRNINKNLPGKICANQKAVEKHIQSPERKSKVNTRKIYFRNEGELDFFRHTKAERIHHKHTCTTWMLHQVPQVEKKCDQRDPGHLFGSTMKAPGMPVIPSQTTRAYCAPIAPSVWKATCPLEHCS